MNKKIFLLISILIFSVFINAGILDNKTRLGANISGNEVSFAIYAPGKESVSVIGDFNNWDKTANPMTVDGDGVWSTKLSLESGEYRYRYVINGKKTIGDPYAKDVDWTGAGPNAVIKVGDQKYNWNDTFFTPKPLNQLVIYETHIGDFSQEGTFNAMAKKVSYLKSLGINCIELMPIMEFPGDISWGYNPAFFFAPETAYGTPNDFKKLVDIMHQNGISVILDTVFNHCAPDCPINQLYPYNQNPYFSTDGNPWGFPDFNHWADCTKRFTKDVLEYWMSEYHIDGFRFDYTVGIGYDGYNGVSYFSWVARQFKNDVYLIAEQLPQDPHMAITTNIDAEWHDTFHDQMKANLREGVFDNVNNWGDLDKTVKGLYFAADGFTDNAQCINYTESHDEERVIYEAQTNPGLNHDAAIQKSKLGAIALFTAAGVPMLYHGQEFGMDTRRTIDPNKLRWNYLNNNSGRDLFNFYKKLIALRKSHKALEFNNLEVMCKYYKEKVIAFKRWDFDGDVIVVILNFDNHQHFIRLPFPYNGKWYEAIYNYDVNVSNNEISNLEIGASSGKIFCLKKTW